MKNNTSKSNIEHRLEELKDVPARNPLQAASGRTRFLNQAADYKQAVSPGKELRQSGWIFPIRKEKLTMNTVVSLILAAALLLGGGGTVAAAQDDLPNQSLYQLKLWTENAKMAMTGDPQEQATLLMNMAQTRIHEMAALVEQGITPPDQVRDRLQTHLHQALQIAADMDEATRERTLLQLRDCLQTQDQIMQQLQLHVDAETEPLLTRTRQMLQTQLHLVDEGLADPQGFQYMMENQLRYGQDEESEPGPYQQGEPGFHQNDESGKPEEIPGTGTGNEAPGGPNPDAIQDGNPGKSENKGEPGGTQGDNDGNGSGGGQSDNGGNGSGGGGGNK
jgi:uncharacterized membrane protein YgcG